MKDVPEDLPSDPRTITIVTTEPEDDLEFAGFAAAAVDELARTEPDDRHYSTVAEAALAQVRSGYPEADIDIATIRRGPDARGRRAITVYRDAASRQPGRDQVGLFAPPSDRRKRGRAGG